MVQLEAQLSNLRVVTKEKSLVAWKVVWKKEVIQLMNVVEAEKNVEFQRENDFYRRLHFKRYRLDQWRGRDNSNLVCYI